MLSQTPPRFVSCRVLAAGRGAALPVARGHCWLPHDPDYRVNCNTPRADDSASVPPDSVTMLSPLNKPVYVFSNVIVGHAARVHASAGPAVTVRPDNANAPLHMLQSTRVDSRSVAMVKV